MVKADALRTLFTILLLQAITHFSLWGQVVNGQFNLENAPSSVVALSGDWRFYPNILSSEDIPNASPQTIKVPGAWNLGASYKKFGYGLYHLRVKGSRHELMALSFDRVYSAYKIYVNDKLIGQCGSPGEEPSSTVAGDTNQPYSFEAPGEEFDIYIVVSNYWHSVGGIIYPIRMGPLEQMLLARSRAIIIDTALIILVAAIAFYALVLYLFNRQLQYLYFFLFCTLPLLRMAAVGEILADILFPDIPFYLISVFRYVGFFLSGCFITLYVSKILIEFSRHWIVKVVVFFSVFCSIGVMIGPTWTGSYFSWLYQLVLTVAIFLFYPIAIRQLRIRQWSFILVVLSVSSISFAFFHDALLILLKQFDNINFWQGYGFTVAAALQTVYFAYENKLLHEKVDRLYHSLTALGMVHKQKEQFEQALISDLKNQLKDGAEKQEVLEDVIKRINQTPSVPARQKAAIENIDIIHKNFINRLKKLYPDLTPNEIEICISLKAKLSTKEIAASRDISPDSVKKAKFRLRKKLDIDSNTDLYEFLDSL